MYGVLAGITKMNQKYGKILNLENLNGDFAACVGNFSL